MIENRKERRRKKKDLKVARAMLLGMEPERCSGLEMDYNRSALAAPYRKGCVLSTHVRVGNVDLRVWGKDVYHLASRYLRYEKQIMENNK